MPRLTGVRQIWTFIGAFTGCIALLLIGPAVARWLLEQEGASTGTRILGVVVGTLAFLPWVPFVVWLYRRSDEYERHMMLLGLAAAYGVAVIGLAAVDYLQTAGFIPWEGLPPAWMLALFGWGVGRLILLVRGRDRA